MRAHIVVRGILTGSLILSVFSPTAWADHTDPREPLSETSGPTADGAANGEGTWDHLANFPPNPGTDLEFFKKRGDTYMSSGTLGQADEQSVGQRIIRLVAGGEVAPEWVADHGSANCPTSNPSGTTGLQHDVQVVSSLGKKKRPRLLVDTTDATGRCHDPDGGGLELIDLGKIHDPESKPREIHLTRHLGTSHNSTVDAKRPWLIYNSNATFNTNAFIEIVVVQTCIMGARVSIEKKRKECRPKVYRIYFQPAWSQQTTNDESELIEGTESACHDITSVGYRLYCAALNATLIFDVKNLTDADGNVKGKALDCELVDGTNTTAKVTDCSALEQGDSAPQAKGWKFLGTRNHVGRDCGGGQTTCNSNNMVPSDQEVAVSHEADPTADKKIMFVSDERGGGIVPGGASCTPGVENPYGNGGIHAYDITDMSNIEHVETPEGERAVFIGEATVASPTFCTSHVMEHIAGEQRLVVAWYSQGIKIVDYFIDDNGALTFRETASFVLPGAQTWVAEDFKIVENDDGTNTYFIAASDIARGIDVVSWTGEPNPIGSAPPAAGLRRSGI
jgi:hypothetical protein